MIQQQRQIYLNYYQWLEIPKKRVYCDKCDFATKQHMFGAFAIDEILRYQGIQFPDSHTLCHLVIYTFVIFFENFRVKKIKRKDVGIVLNAESV